MRAVLLALALTLTACDDSSTPVVAPVEQPVVVEPQGMELVSHRGIDAPDNTIEGFTNALNFGFTSIEMDLRMHNGVVVLAHDKTIDGVVYETLEDTLLFVSNADVKVWLEAKETAVITPVIEMLEQYNLDVVFMSGNKHDVDLIKELSDLETGRIVGSATAISTVEADWIVIRHTLVLDNYDDIKHFKIAAWTFRTQQEFDDVKDYIDAAISDVQLF